MKNIFVKQIKKSTDIESDIGSDELSDELKKISGINNVKKEFDITNIYSDISKCLYNYKSCNITGEVISFKISDNNAWINIRLKEYQITGIFWKISNDKQFEELKLISSGDKIIFLGNFSIMKKNLNIYFNIKSMEKVGKGKYLDIYEQYRIKIREFKIPKKELLIFPYSIGIITSLEGAAIQDIIQTLKLDNFKGNVIIKNSLVQGANCSKSLINSVEWFELNYNHKIDLLMITRGGGSYEDLVGFSDWNLIVKLSNTSFITLSAVGHQTDNQLTDEICDYKFATPSLGAKFIVEKQQKYLNYLSNYKNELFKIFNSYKISIKNFDYVTLNYSLIIKKFEFSEMLSRIKKYNLILNNLLNKYSSLKNIFYAKLSNLKPTIRRKNNELISINDFVNKNLNKEISPKKIEILFVDGTINITYKINNYEFY